MEKEVDDGDLDVKNVEQGWKILSFLFSKLWGVGAKTTQM